MYIARLICLYELQAGPGTIAEALIRGLPIVLNDYIPGQVSDQNFYTGYFTFMSNVMSLMSFSLTIVKLLTFPFIRVIAGKGQCTLCRRQWSRSIHQKSQGNSKNCGGMVQHKDR